MTNQELVALTIELTREQKQQIEQLAHERGFESASEYVLSLVTQDAEEDAIDPEESFRRGWHEAMTGKTRPIEAVWDELDDE
jgi:Arc/MetJ-type ribon-helix-helix transcriptional regulator